MAGVSERSQPATNRQYQDTGSPYFNGEPDSLASMDWSIRTFPAVRLRMKKNEAEAEIRSLMTRWKRSEHPDTPVNGPDACRQLYQPFRWRHRRKLESR